MKYIRTNDGRIIAYDENSSKEDLPMILNYQNQILAQADTIEELCDEFVGYVGVEYVKGEVNFDMPNFQTYNLKEMLTSMSYDKEDCVVFGAIWTSKGLIFVAKMNQEGVLELI